VVFGVFDLLNDLGVEYTKQSEGAKYSRAKIPVDARAAGIHAIDGIWQDLKDTKGLEEDCRIGKNLGYSGKSLIHPDQISITHKIFHPNKTEIEWAKKVCKEYQTSVKKGKGATTIDGKMIDEVHYKQAKSLLDLIKST
jgi:citrate lyase subunit beta/citryl-CoA lyase